MPFIHIEILNVLEEGKKQQLVEEITDSVARISGNPREKVFIFFEQLRKDGYARGGKLVSVAERVSIERCDV